MIDPKYKKMSMEHYEPYEKILQNQARNFKNFLSELTTADKSWWFNDVDVQTLEDLKKISIKSTVDIIDSQKINPPYGVWGKESIVHASSKSVDNIRKVFPRSLDRWHRCTIGAARSLENHGINETDSIMTTDSGGMFMGHQIIEDAAILHLGVTRIRHYTSVLSEILNTANEFGVTVFSGSPVKLARLAKLNPAKKLQRPLKMLISTGALLENAQDIAEAFGVKNVVNMYGSSEMTNIAWTCSHGHFHVNIDLIYIEQGKYFSNLTNLPIFRYHDGETLDFSYKGTCLCGSNLPTVDRLLVSVADRSKKD
jgi:phenylacetate-coenzyme A ligase PaaK-like adenylate-forming protein